MAKKRFIKMNLRVVIVFVFIIIIVFFVVLKLLMVRENVMVFEETVSSFSFRLVKMGDKVFQFIVCPSNDSSCCLVFQGYGGNLNFFSSVDSYIIKPMASRKGFLLSISSRKEGVWSANVYTKVFELPRLVLMNFSAILILYGENYIASGTFRVEGSSSCMATYYTTVTKPKWVYTVVIGNGARELMNILFIELSGPNSVYTGETLEFLYTKNIFGPTFAAKNILGRRELRFRAYIWNPECINCIFYALQSEAQICASKLNISENIELVKSSLQSLLKPKKTEDIFLISHIKKLFKAYVGDIRNSFSDAEMITQVNVLLGLAYSFTRLGLDEAREQIKLVLENSDNFDVFWDERVGVYSNNVYAAGRMDSWYQVTNPTMLIEAHKLMPDTIQIDVGKLSRHADFLIKLAHKVEYDFPVFVWPDMRVEHIGVEADVALGYSYFMYLMYKLSGNRTYLEESIKALDTYMTKNYGKLYESHLTAMGIAASVALYEEMGEERFVEYTRKLLYQALMWVQPTRGDIVKEDVPYTLVVAMPNIYHAAFEYGLFKYFIEIALNVSKNMPIKNAIEDLYNFYSWCGAVTAKYSFPHYLGITIRSIAQGGVIDPYYLVPIEDIYPLRSYKSASLPQEIYGAGSQIIILIPPHSKSN